MRLRYILLSLWAPVFAAAQPTGPTPDWVAVGTGAGEAAVTAIADGVSWGGVLAAGHFRGEVVFGSHAATAPDTTTAAFLAVFGSEGAVQWLRAARSPGGRVVATGVATVVTGSGPSAVVDVVVTGYATAPVFFDSGSAVASYFYVGPGRSDGFVARYSATGELRYVLGMRGSGGVWPAAMVASSGGVLVVGAFDGTVAWDAGETVVRTAVGGRDGFAARYRADGSLERIETVGGPADDALTDVVASPFTGAWASGSFRARVVVAGDTLDSRGGADAIAIRYGVDGAPTGVVHVGNAGDQTGDGIHSLDGGPFGAVVLGGTFSDSLTVDGQTIRSRGGTDIFLTEISAETLDIAFTSHVGGGGADRLHDVASVGAFYGDIGGDAYLIAASAADGVVVPTFIYGSPTSPDIAGYGGTDAVAATFVPALAWGPGTYAATLAGGPGTDQALAATGVGCGGGGFACWSAAIGGSFEETARFGSLVVTGGPDMDAFVAHYPKTVLTPFFVADEPAPAPVSSLTVAPNPARGGATVRLAVEAPSERVTVRVHDALGRIVAVLHDGPLGAGETAWMLPASLPAGRYLVRVTGGATASIPVTVVR